MKSRRPRDAALWAALAVPAVSADAIGLNEPRPLWGHLAGLAILAAAAATWRARPVTAFLLAASPGLTAPALFTVSYGPALAALALLLGRHGARVRPALLAFAAVAAVGTARIVVRDVDPVVEWLVLLGTLLFGAVFPWLAGRYWRQGRELAAAGWDRAAQLEREQRIVADRARLRERARIAQDMHDSLGHELSLIAVRAGALQVAADLPEHHKAAASDLRVAAADATDRLRDIIGVLRDEGDEAAPLAPPGETVAQLVARAAESGLPVRYAADGTEPPGSAGRLAHRVVQEALTNAAKYAPGAPVTVTATRTGAGTTIEVANAAPPGPAATPGTGPRNGGSGLADLRTRVEASGGTLTAGAHRKGFRVLAHVPETTAAATADGTFRPPSPSSSPPPAPPARPGAVIALARRRTALAFGAAIATGTVLVAGAFGWYAYIETHSVLRPADYAALRVGQPRSEVAAVLPDRSVTDPPVERAPSPPPPGADCRYYRSGGQLFTSLRHFRLCFDDGRLVDKTVIPKAGADPREREGAR
ncbi:ATP-binding protein [Streptomyces sp. p1417]|uniref:histidine kinase n=1 Tax=Streptomyces typhae TaxID=2681492 RepID=A0A6L6WZ34_9ACTN|nr:histidine kinase [Streptomyces typhae]MVO86766.1 ATP-binding protein [Streptomyces typhae]